MTPSVADKTPILATSWRRHTDSPLLWMVVFITSISLHLLAFWLMRSSHEISPWFPQQSQGAIPIELIDLSPTAKPLAKSIPTTTKTPPKTSTTKSTTETEQAPISTVTVTSTPTPSPSPTKTSTPTPSPTPSPTKTSTPTPSPTPSPTKTSTPLGSNFPGTRRQEINFGKGKPLTGLSQELKGTPESSTTPSPESSTTPSPESSTTPSPESSTTPSPESSPTPSPESSPTPSPESSTTPSPESSPNTSGGVSIATITPIQKDEQSQLIQQGTISPDGLTDIPAVYQGSDTKQLDASFLPGDSGIESANLLVSIVIDNTGKFQQAIVLKIAPPTLQGEKSKYEKVLNDLFKTDKYTPAQNNDGSKPNKSNLFLRIIIQPSKPK